MATLIRVVRSEGGQVKIADSLRRVRAVVLAAAWPLAGPGCALVPTLPSPGSAFALPAQTLEGEPVELGGPGKIRLIDVWATWCAPCREVSPQVEAVLLRHPEVRGIFLSIDDVPEQARAYAARHFFPGEWLYLPGGGAGAQAAGITAIPLVVVLDAQGRVVDAFHLIEEARLERALAAARGRAG
jgi:thiol-disulfide isomerase/thioredoxin